MRAVNFPTSLLALLGTAGLFASIGAVAQEPAAAPPVEVEKAPQVEAPAQSQSTTQPAPSTAQPAPEPAATATPAPRSAPIETPARGSTMDRVKAKFGQPSQEVPAVGQPPISRWEYPGYIVYFEYDKVLHTVVAR